ncbi:hypothetical protein D3C76_102590 [compost metagenome]
MTLPNQFSLTNKAILLDLSHVKSVGDEITQGGIVLGTVQVSETPTYGTVVAYDPELEGKIAVGDVIPLPSTGVLRSFEYPGKGPKTKVAIIKFDMIDGVVKQ